MYQVFLEKHENLYKTWVLKTYKSIWAKIVLKNIDEWIEDYSHRDKKCIYSMQNCV